MKTRPASTKKKNGKNHWEKAQKYIERQVTQQVEGKIEEAQQHISEQLKGDLDRQVNTKLKREVAQQISRRLGKNLENGFLKMQHGIQANRFLYGFSVGIGFFLFWYGAWQIIPLIPVLNQGLVALIIGSLLLFITGTLYYKIVGPSSK